MKKIFIALLSVFLCSASFTRGFTGNYILPEKVSNQLYESGAKVTDDDANKDADKKSVIEKATKEVFTNYSNQIDTLKKYNGQASLMTYIDAYVKDETAKIAVQITNKTYVHQYATTEKYWLDTDFAEVAAILKVRTLDRIEKIAQDVQDLSPGLHTMTDDKLRLLEKEVTAEIKDDVVP